MGVSGDRLVIATYPTSPPLSFEVFSVDFLIQLGVNRLGGLMSRPDLLNRCPSFC